MAKRHTFLIPICTAVLVSAACTGERQGEPEVINNTFPEAQAEIREAIQSIESDVESSNIEGMQAIHLKSDKFTKFGPRNFDRQNLASTNQSEGTFFSSISDANYEVSELKIDVFGDIGIATFYSEINFVRNGEKVEGSGRQTLVFLNTDSGWKLVHEHGTPRD